MHQPIMLQTRQSRDRLLPDQPRQSDEVAQASAELHVLEMKRGELKSQLQGLTERRALLSAQEEDADGPIQRELQGRIQALDNRTAVIDNQLNAIDDQITALIDRGARPEPSGFQQLIQGMQTTERPGRGPFGRGPDFGGGSGILPAVLVGQGVGFLLIAFVLWRALRRRGAPRLSQEDAGRLDQLQRSVDVMAVEVERISEGQRYVAKLLGDQAPGLAASAAQNAGVNRDPERLRASRDSG